MFVSELMPTELAYRVIPATALPNYLRLKKKSPNHARQALQMTMRNWSWACDAWLQGIYDDQGKLIAGLSISAPADRLDESWLRKLRDTARNHFTWNWVTLKPVQERVQAAAALLNPAANAFSICRTAEFTGGVQKDDDQFTTRYLGLHHQALTRF
jgi:hypothetical protein